MNSPITMISIEHSSSPLRVRDYDDPNIDKFKDVNRSEVSG